MPSPTQQQVHVDQPLTNISIAYRNAAYIAEQVFPNVSVQKQTDKSFTFNKADWYRDEAGPRAPGTRAPRVEYGISTSNYLCFPWAAGKPLPDETVDNSDNPLRPEMEATEFVTEKLFLKKEILVSDDAFGTGWSSSATPATLWSNDTSDPIGDVNLAVDTVAQAIGREPNKGVVGRGLWRHVVKHPDLIDRIKGAAGPGSPAILTKQAIAALFELETILVGTAVKETGAEGATSSRSNVWGNHLLVAYVTSSPALMTATAGYVFTWKTRVVERFREDQEKQWIITCEENFDSKVTASDAAYLIKSAA